MIKEQQLTEQEELREKLIGKIEVLDKVKQLLLLPDTKFATTKQVAEYYETTEENIRQIKTRFKNELSEDGVKTIRGIKKVQEITKGSLQNVTTVITIYSRRAVLRVGMLLRDSEVAKEVRTQLLNIEEKTDDEQKTKEINKEKLLFMDIMFAENESDRAIAVNELYKYNQRNKIKIDYHDTVLHADKLITTNDVAKDLGITDRKLYKILRENKILYKQGKIYKPYANYDFLLKENYADYHINEWSQTFKWYEKGRKWVINNIDNWNK
ncbi:conserved hypothetical protein [Clostridium botulinum C str. Eklund]|nr:conserved hypothetical protein [Clostridium botulinum C str. Eklund]